MSVRPEQTRKARELERDARAALDEGDIDRACNLYAGAVREMDCARAALASSLSSLEAEREKLTKGLRPGATWINKHTGGETSITSFASRVERIPDPRGGFKDDPQLVVHHTANAPPGFKRGHGDDLGSFLEHWHPAALESAGSREDRLDDKAIAREIEERDRTDTGERMTLEELAAEVGVDLPAGSREGEIVSNDPTRRAEATTTPEASGGWDDPTDSEQSGDGGDSQEVAPMDRAEGVRAEARHAKYDGTEGDPSNVLNAVCPRCNGGGEVAGFDSHGPGIGICPVCKGTGQAAGSQEENE